MQLKANVLESAQQYAVERTQENEDYSSKHLKTDLADHAIRMQMGGQVHACWR